MGEFLPFMWLQLLSKEESSLISNNSFQLLCLSHLIFQTTLEISTLQTRKWTLADKAACPSHTVIGQEFNLALATKSELIINVVNILL